MFLFIFLAYNVEEIVVKHGNNAKEIVFGVLSFWETKWNSKDFDCSILLSLHPNFCYNLRLCLDQCVVKGLLKEKEKKRQGKVR